MSEPTNEEIVRSYIAAMEAHDLDGMERLRHEDYVLEWPQSGERIRGAANARAIDEHIPQGLPELESVRIVGSEDQWVTTPAFTIQRVVGSGDTWWADGRVRYPDGSTWHIVSIMELRDGLVHHETNYFAEPFDAPDWRAPWVERMG